MPTLYPLLVFSDSFWCCVEPSSPQVKHINVLVGSALNCAFCLGSRCGTSLRTQPIAASSRSTIWSGGNGLRWVPPS